MKLSHFVLLSAIVLSLGLVGHAEPSSNSLPSAPIAQAKPAPVFHRLDYAESSVLVISHLADYLSTEQGVREPLRFHEHELPQALVHSHVGLALYEAGTAGLEIFGAYELNKHGHHRIARALQAANIGFTARTVANNFALDWHTSPIGPHIIAGGGIGAR